MGKSSTNKKFREKKCYPSLSSSWSSCRRFRVRLCPRGVLTRLYAGQTLYLGTLLTISRVVDSSFAWTDARFSNALPEPSGSRQARKTNMAARLSAAPRTVVVRLTAFGVPMERKKLLLVKTNVDARRKDAFPSKSKKSGPQSK